jgi:hypothetical protein
MKTIILTALIGAAIAATQADAGPAWVQLVEGHAEARLVTDAPRCPLISIGGHLRRMTQRADAPTDFADKVC